VTVNNPITNPVATSAQTICNGSTPAGLTSTAAIGGSGSFTYQWESTTDGLNWTVVGTNSLNYQPGPLTVTTTFHLIALDNGATSCGSVVSNDVIITVNTAVTAGTLSADQLISSGTAPATLSLTPGSGGGVVSYVWESSTNGTTWTVVTGAVLADCAPGILNQTTWYRRTTVATENTVVCQATTTPVKISVDIKLQISVMLEGAYNTGTNTMNANLNAVASAPAHANYIPLAQPYNGAPWNYAGTESVGAMPTGVVDWVLIEIRQATTPTLATSGTILAKRAAFVKQDGSVVELDGTTTIHFSNYAVSSGNNLYIVVRHRNHLAVMSSAGATLAAGVYSYDFTTGLGQALGGANGYKAMGTKFGMVNGDIDQDGNIFVSDYNRWAVNFGVTSGYFSSDLDMDNNVFVSDYNKWAVNFGSAGDPKLKAAKLDAKYVSGVPK
jgi:hypothetical protein